MSVLSGPRIWLAVNLFTLGAHAHNVVCWGAARTIPSTLPTSKRVAVSKDFACSLDYEGGVTCFGTIPSGKTKPSGLPAVRQINAGFDNVCVVTEVTRAVECWGGDGQGQSTPPALPGTTEAVSCGDWVCCAISLAGDCTCWGANTNGEANGPPSGFVATHVACGRGFCCAGDTGGAVQCWGLESASTRTTYENGQVTPPNGLPPSAALTCGQANVCSSSTTGQVTCWGGGSPHQTSSKIDNNQGEFGSLGLGTAVELASGKFTTCVLQDDGHVVCAGTKTSVPASIQGKVAHIGGEFDTLCASLVTTTTTTTTESTSTATTITVSTMTSRTSTTTSSSTTSETVTSSSTSSTTRSGTSTTSSTSTVSSTSSTTSSTSTSTTSTSSSSSSSSSTSSISSTTSSTTTSTSSSSTTSTSSTSSVSSSTSTSSTSTSSTSTSSTSTSSTSTSSTSTSSTSSTSSSTVTSSSTSSSSSSSTTSHTAPYVSGSDGLLSFYGDLEAAELERLWTGNASESRLERADVLLLVTRVPSTGEEVTVNVAENVTMTLPGSLLPAIDGPVAAVVSVFKDDKLLKRINGVDNDGYEAKVQAAMKLELHTPSGPYSVSASKEPLLLGLPVDKNLEQVACAYWDIRRKRWSYRGVTARKGTGSLVCATTHLTLFAAILRGFLTALACSQLTLFNSGALRQLSRLSWLASPVGAAYLLVLLLFGGLMLAACMLDAKRRKTWKDEFFLIPSPGADEGSLELHEGEGSASLGLGSASLSQISPTAASHAAGCLAGCKEHSILAFKEACTEILSSFFDFFGSLREVCGQCMDSMSNYDRDEGVLRSLVLQTSRSFAKNCMRQQLAAKIGFSDEAVGFVMEDPDLLTVLSGTAKNAAAGGRGASRSIQAWYDLHQRVAEELDRAWQRVGTARGLHRVVGQLFILANPFAAIYTVNPFWPSDLRALVLMIEMSGTLLLGVILFQNTAAPQGMDSPDDCEANGFWEQVGQMIMIGLASALFAALPPAILSRLHSRKLLICSCDENYLDFRDRQLRIWGAKDKMLWALGSFYIAFSLFVVALFLANIHPNDQPDWGVSGLTSLAEDAVIMPLALAIMAPLIAIIFVAISASLTGKARTELVSLTRRKLEDDQTWVLLPSVTAREPGHPVSV